MSPGKGRDARKQADNTPVRPGDTIASTKTRDCGIGRGARKEADNSPVRPGASIVASQLTSGLGLLGQREAQNVPCSPETDVWDRLVAQATSLPTRGRSDRHLQAHNLPRHPEATLYQSTNSSTRPTNDLKFLIIVFVIQCLYFLIGTKGTETVEATSFQISSLKD